MWVYVLITLCAILYYVRQSMHTDYWKKRNVVQRDGVLWKFLFGNRSLPEYIADIYRTNDTHVGIVSGSQRILILKDLDDVQAALASDFQSFYKRGIIFNENDVLANNVLFIDDFKKWKILRQKLSPIFTSAKLRNMFYILDRCGKDFADFVEKSQNMRDKPFNALYTYTTASIAASVFGIDTGMSNTMDSPFLTMSWEAVLPTMKSKFKFFLSGTCPKLFKLLKLKVFGDHENFFVGAVRDVLESRRHETVKRHDFIDVCLELQRNGVMKDLNTGYELEPTTEILAAQAFFFFLAGTDTTANTMHFTLLLLASHPKILAKVHKEIDAVLEGKDGLTSSDIDKLQYLDMVLSEAMRMYPAIGAIQRMCTKDTLLPGSGVKIERGVAVMIPIYGIHRDENLFPNPNTFDPERFAPNNLSQIKKFSYLPFGEGNRICIGARFARLQTLAGLTWLLHRFTLAEQEYKPDHFERSSFSLRDSEARYDLISRQKLVA